MYGSDAMTGIFAAFMSSAMCLTWVIPMVVGVAFTVLWIITLVDLIQRPEGEFPNAIQGRQDPNERLLWLLIILLVGGIGSIAYYLIVMKPYPRNRIGQ